jgi:hypothetical protein
LSELDREKERAIREKKEKQQTQQILILYDLLGVVIYSKKSLEII